MTVPVVLIVAALTFLVCFGLDKLFTKLLRSQAQHHSGTAVRLRKGYAIAGLLLLLLAAIMLVNGMVDDSALMTAAFVLLLIIGIGLVVYYISYGIFYDRDTFLVTSFGKKNRVYRYSQITGQLLYRTNDAVMVELHLDTGASVAVYSNMAGAYAFLDAAFAAWCRQRDVEPESCDFHDPSNHLWFPSAEKEAS